ncbi:MAG: hypothetical protein SH868_15885 [Bythopirellula sp.]|nr:hypothetical protein [Bythopirellula sp.]
MIVRSTIALALVLCCSFSYAEEIPLDQIWALDMPGTKDVHDLEPNQDALKGMTATELIEKSLVGNTRWLLNANRRPPYGSQGERGFVVAATGLEALKQANAVLSKEKPRREIFSAGEELTLVFFSYSCGRDVRLDGVSRSGRKITVKYHFYAHSYSQSTTHFALVPIGKFSAGNVKVKIERMPDESLTGQSSPMDQGRVRQTVCESFTFGVEEH